MLWHVFRYRDGRQKDAKGPERDHSSLPPESEDDGSGGGGRSSSVSTTNSAPTGPGKPAGENQFASVTDELVLPALSAVSQRAYFDPVRNQYRD